MKKNFICMAKIIFNQNHCIKVTYLKASPSKYPCNKHSLKRIRVNNIIYAYTISTYHTDPPPCSRDNC